ncbi:MAG: anti-sigma factor family protein [Blastocatellia bacterium]
MDCRNYKELLDSYLCQELAVETNHQMLHHAEHCQPCRTEMALRRNMRETLRRACSQDNLSNEALERMRSRLRAEAFSPNTFPAGFAQVWRNRLAGFFNFRILIPIFAILALAIGASFYLNYLKNQSSPNKASLLSESLMIEAAEDHRDCSSHYISSTKPAAMPDSVREYDEACLELDKVALSGATGLTLRAAHVCQPTTRKFAHLVYTRDENLISLLVTKRDGRALKTGELAPFDANLHKTQANNTGELAINAYQTSKHVILVVSNLPKFENEKLAQTLALPVVEHIRRLDNQATNLRQIEVRKLIASTSRRELK